MVTRQKRRPPERVARAKYVVKCGGEIAHRIMKPQRRENNGPQARGKLLCGMVYQRYYMDQEYIEQPDGARLCKTCERRI